MAQVVREFLENPAEPQFGFDLMETLKLSSGTLYPILTKLRVAGWITGRTEDIDPKAAGRPARRYYLLTPEGEVAAVRALTRMGSMYEVPLEAARRVSRRPGFAGGQA